MINSGLSITHLEALNLVHAVSSHLPPSPHEFLVIVNTDETSQQVLQTCNGRDVFLCACTHQIWLIAATFNFELGINHKAGKDLVLTDAYSHFFDSIGFRDKAADLCTSLNLTKITAFIHLCY